MFNRVERIVSFRNLRPKKKEGFLKVISLFSFLGISLGVAVLIIVMSVMNGFRTDLTNKILGLNPHIVIEHSREKIPKKYTSELIKKYPQFEYAEIVNGEGIIVSNNNTLGVLVKGISNSDFKKNNISNKLVDGSKKDLSKNKIIIGAELAFDLNVKVDDNLTLMSPSFISTPIGSLPKQEIFTISGIFNSGFYEFDKKLIYLNKQDALTLFSENEKKINLEIYLKNPLEANKYKAKIQSDNPNFYIYTWSDINKSFFSALKVERNVMFIILTLIIVVAAFNIISGLTILIKNKTKEIAILKCLGLSNKSIKKTFFLTGFVIGFFATVTGIIIGVIFSIYIEEIRLFLSTVFNINIFPADVYILEKLPSEINLNSIFLIFFFSLVITAISSYLPVRSISKNEILSSLKYE